MKTSNHQNPIRLVTPLALAGALVLALAGPANTARAVNGNWTNNNSSVWSAATNWDSNPTVPGTAAGDMIGLTNHITTGRTITIDQAVTLGTLNIGDTNYTAAFTLATNGVGGSALTFDNSGSGARLNEVATSKGDTISAATVLADNLTITNASTNAFTISGVVSGAGKSIVINNPNGEAVILSGANTFSGGTILSSGILKVGASSTAGAGGVTNGPTGSGNLTLSNGVTLACADSNGRSVAAPTIFIAGNVTLGQAVGGTGRLSVDGTWNLGGASRTITLGKASANYASGSEVFRFEQLGGFTVPQVTNGSLTLTTTTGSAATPSIARIINTTSFTNNLSLTLDDGVAMSSGNGSFFITGLGAPALTLNAPVSKGGGVLQMGDGTTGATSNAVVRVAEIYSLSGGGTVSATNFTGATNTVTPTTGTLTINNGNGATFSGTILDFPTLGKLNLTKSGAGAQTLSGNDSYCGTTTVSGGSLLVNGTHTVTNGANGYYLVTSGGTLGGSGSIDLSAVNLGVTNKSGGKISPGAASGAIGTLTFTLGTGTLDISGGLGAAGSLVYDLTNGSSDEIVLASGALNIGSGLLNWNSFAFNNLGNISGAYTLIQTPGISGALGSPLSGFLSGGYTGTISQSGNNIILTVVPPNYWTGSVSTNFETGGNWNRGSAPANDLTTDVALFNGAPTANQPALTASRSLSGINFSNTTGGWSLTGNANNVLSLGANGINSSATGGTNTISGALNVAASQTWKAGTGGNLLFTGSITNAQNATTNYAILLGSTNAAGNIILSPSAGNSINLTGTNGATILQLTNNNLVELGGDGTNAPLTTSVNYLLNGTANYGCLKINGAGSKLQVNSGTWNIGDFNRNAGVDAQSGILEINGGTLAIAGARYLGGGTINVNGGNLKLTATNYLVSNGGMFQLGYTPGGSTNVAVMNLKGGFVDLAVSSIVGGAANGIGANTSSLLNQSGGTLQNGVTPGVVGGSSSFNIGGVPYANGTTNNRSAYTLTGGTFISAGTVQGGTNASNGSMNNFNFMGGTLAVAAVDATWLGSCAAATTTSGQTNSSDNLGMLVNYGGTLAPGGDGTAGEMSITGGYVGSNSAAVLAIDIGGTNAASTFQTNLLGNYDYLHATTNIVLGGSLKISLGGGFVPSATDQYNIIQCNYGGPVITGTFDNLNTNLANEFYLGRVMVANMTNATFAVTISGLTNTVYLSGFQVASSTASYSTNITATVTGGGSTLNIAWPTTHLGWILQAQTNSASVGLATNWVDNLGTVSVTSTNLPIDPANPSVFFRLRHP